LCWRINNTQPAHFSQTQSRGENLAPTATTQRVATSDTGGAIRSHGGSQVTGKDPGPLPVEQALSAAPKGNANYKKRPRLRRLSAAAVLPLARQNAAFFDSWPSRQAAQPPPPRNRLTVRCSANGIPRNEH
jgi:hypothetical protein